MNGWHQYKIFLGDVAIACCSLALFRTKHNAEIVRNGEYMTNAIRKAEEKIQEKRKNELL